ncbi:ABC transporter permease [Aeromicrobium sp. YIM 150415]|uniref:ABC transporter permease n=1 Tax=Aeromicrobium sp. YIM 150415 TaxID=2803912 RepID=UPI001965C090|nr:ABC transporter permease [Aeromicrobium sp. YIM 150415]MBM9462287.1 ABC transporter permease [Aeromicrobium sp. YIM 150415]
MGRLHALRRELRSPGPLIAAAFLLLLIVAALLAPWLAPHDPLGQSSDRLVPPGGSHLLGTDQFGRDVFSRLVTGARVDLLVSFGAAGLAALIGVTVGLVGGTSRGAVRMLTMRGIEVILAFPPIVFALLVVTLFGPGAFTLVITMGILFAPSFARIVYGEVLTIDRLEYVQASRVIGSSRRRILGRVILPGVLPPVLVQLSLTVATAMLLSSGLSYLGLGVVPPTPSWGGMIAEGQALMMRSPLLLLFSSGVVVATVLSFSVLADALERALDPRRGRRGRRPSTPVKPLSVS